MQPFIHATEVNGSHAVDDSGKRSIRRLDITWAHLMNELGACLVAINVPSAAIRRYDQSLEVFRQSGDWEGQARTLTLHGLATFEVAKSAEELDDNARDDLFTSALESVRLCRDMHVGVYVLCE